MNDPSVESKRHKYTPNATIEVYITDIILRIIAAIKNLWRNHMVKYIIGDCIFKTIKTYVTQRMH